ncbi:MAG: hypothetical protein EOP22_10175 [Hyphomicrobiales bacterium]|nr:MAG: hypothetical protein EOP22_10175 [Hyphomicrobiales bacterium]
MVLNISRVALVAATLSLSAPLLPAMAQETTQSTETAPFAFEISVPNIVALDSSMSEDQLKAVFSASFLDHAGALASLNATEITIPLLKATFNIEDGGTSTVEYHNIVLSNVKDGLAAKVSVTSGRTDSQGESTTQNGISADNFDIKRLLEFTGMVKGDPSAPFKPIITAATSAGSSQSSPFYSCSFGGSTTSTFEARPSGTAFADVLAVIQSLDQSSEPSPAQIKTMVGYAVDLFRGFRGGGGDIGAVDCNVPGDTPASLKIAGASTGGFEPALYPQVKVSGISVEAGELGHGALGEFVLKPIDFNPTLNALGTNLADLSEEWFDKNWRLLIPSFSGLSLSGFDIDAPNPDKPSERVQAKVDSFDLTLADYFNGIPTKFSTSAKGIDVPLPQNTTDPQMQMLLAAGLTKLNVGFDVAAAWDKASETIGIDKFGIAAVDLGSLTLGASVGNAQEELFALDENIAMAAGLGVTVKQVTIRASDDGIGAIVWPLAAAQEGQTDIVAFRAQMAGFAEGLAIQLLGSNEAARQLGVAVSDFVTGEKGALTITITAKAPGGVPLALFMAAQNDPSILASQVDIVGKAE